MLRWMPILLLACKPAPPRAAPAALPSPPSEAVVPPGDPDAEVRDTIARYSGQLRYCYELRLKAHPSLQGRVEVEWTVQHGAVQASRVLFNDTGDDDLASCITRRLASWRFHEGLTGELSWPFVFRAQ